MRQTVGIGHTRWATHGKPSLANAHPQVSDDGRFAVVHNGIIENASALRRELTASGVFMRSDTDTEVIAQLLQREFRGDMNDAIRRVTERLEGSLALGIVYAGEPHCLYAVRRRSPLLLGVADDGVLLASDVSALLSHTHSYVAMQDGEHARLSADGYTIYDADGRPVEREVQKIEWNSEAAQRGHYAHFMRKEIEEQPTAIAETLRSYLTGDGEASETALPLPGVTINKLQRVVLVGCGSAYHAGIVGREALEQLAQLPTAVELASEFRDRSRFLNDQTLVIAISQSGETADTLAALREAKRRGAPTLAIVNVPGSTLAAESDAVFFTRAGPEVAVATTKAYSTQLVALYLIALRLADLRGTVDHHDRRCLTAALQALPSRVETALQTAERLHSLARERKKMRDAYFIGRGMDYAVAAEAALKLKEISYIHAEAYAAGELKHGTLSLIEQDTLVVAIACDGKSRDKTLANVQEVRARGAWVLLVTDEPASPDAADEILQIPATHPLLRASTTIIPMQLLAYYTALERGCDIDYPRNLAKSVTVE